MKKPVTAQHKVPREMNLSTTIVGISYKHRGPKDSAKQLRRVNRKPRVRGEFQVRKGLINFSDADRGRKLTIHYKCRLLG
jgi:hypothetical protein